MCIYLLESPPTHPCQRDNVTWGQYHQHIRERSSIPVNVVCQLMQQTREWPTQPPTELTGATGRRKPFSGKTSCGGEMCPTSTPSFSWRRISECLASVGNHFKPSKHMYNRHWIKNPRWVTMSNHQNTWNVFSGGGTFLTAANVPASLIVQKRRRHEWCCRVFTAENWGNCESHQTGVLGVEFLMFSRRNVVIYLGPTFGPQRR